MEDEALAAATAAAEDEDALIARVDQHRVTRCRIRCREMMSKNERQTQRPAAQETHMDKDRDTRRQTEVHTETQELTGTAGQI